MKKTGLKRLITVIVILAMGFTGLNINVAKATGLAAPKNFKGIVTLPIDSDDYEGDPDDLTDEEQTDLFARTKLNITWDSVSGADGYQIFSRTNISGEDTWEKWQTIKASETTAQGSIIDGVFQMKVRAYKGSQYSEFTDVITVEGGKGIIKNPAIKLNSSKKSIYIGSTDKLTLKNAIDTVTWKSSNNKVATVNQKGVITAKKKGSCTVTAISNGHRYNCKITVKSITWKYAYHKVLLKNINQSKFFYLLDIDQNGSKELLISDCSVASSSDWRVYIYTFSNGALHKLGVSAQGELSYYKSSKCLKNDIEGYGSLSLDGEPQDWTEYYKIQNGKAVSVKKVNCKGKGSTFRWYSINKTNIDKYCK